MIETKAAVEAFEHTWGWSTDIKMTSLDITGFFTQMIACGSCLRPLGLAFQRAGATRPLLFVLDQLFCPP
jgi:hypothetical protein